MNYGIKPHDTNIKLVKKYMKWGSPINQMFLIDAISKVAENITKDPVKVRQQFRESGAENWVSADGWIHAAQDWLECQRIRNDES